MKHESRRVRRARKERAARARRRKIFARTAVLFSVIAVMTAAGINLLTTAFARDNTAAYDTVIVASGDTLWDIAAEYNTQNRDIRAVIDGIMRVNDMKSTRICAGDKIFIPIQ